jgi:hypothetical protein
MEAVFELQQTKVSHFLRNYLHHESEGLQRSAIRYPEFRAALHSPTACDDGSYQLLFSICGSG